MYIVGQHENLQAAYDNEQNRHLIKDISTGKDVALSEGEFNEIGSAFRSNSSYELFLRKLEYRGIVLLDEGLIDGPARESRQIKNQVPEESLTVMLDTTTIFNALSCVGLQPNVNPIALLDLSVLTFAALCFDHIIV